MEGLAGMMDIHVGYIIQFGQVLEVVFGLDDGRKWEEEVFFVT